MADQGCGECGRISLLENALRDLLKAAEDWHGTAWCEGLAEFDWQYEPAVVVALAVLNK